VPELGHRRDANRPTALPRVQRAGTYSRSTAYSGGLIMEIAGMLLNGPCG